MKARLSSTVWLLVFWVTLLLTAAVGFSYYAGSHSAADAAVPGGANGALVGAIYPGIKAARQDAIEALSYD